MWDWIIQCVFKRLITSPTQGAGCGYCTVKKCRLCNQLLCICLSQTRAVCQTVRWVLKYIWQHEISSSITPSVRPLGSRTNTPCLLAIFTNTKWRDVLILTTPRPFAQHFIQLSAIHVCLAVTAEQRDDQTLWRFSAELDRAIFRFLQFPF